MERRPTKREPAESDLDRARRLDAADPLAPFRSRFVLPDPSLIYLDGNSLGRLPTASAARLQQEIQQEWAEQLIRGWNRGWYEAPERIGERIAPLIGAAPGQVVVSDSTSVNLYKLVHAALALRPDRHRIVSSTFNFPTDLYVVQGCIAAAGHRHRLDLVASEDEIHLPTEEVIAAIDEETALVTLSHVAFKSGFLHDGARISAAAREAGALILWDLSHSVGAVPVDLDGWGADMAVGCTYKYLNGGPGAPAFLYVAHAIQAACRSPIQGWFGQQAPFDFDLAYHPAPGVRRFLVGTPPVLSLAAIEPALDLHHEAGMEPIRRKSVALSEFLLDLFDRRLVPLGFSLGSPRNADHRGSHLSLRHSDAYRICRALIEEVGVLPDFRAPDHIRLGLAPLYLGFEQLHEAVVRLEQVVREDLHLRYPSARLSVT